MRGKCVYREITKRIKGLEYRGEEAEKRLVYLRGNLTVDQIITYEVDRLCNENLGTKKIEVEYLVYKNDMGIAIRVDQERWVTLKRLDGRSLSNSEKTVARENSFGDKECAEAESKGRVIVTYNKMKGFKRVLGR